jgi:YHS domain-containing protein
MRLLILVLVFFWAVALLRRAVAWLLGGTANHPQSGHGNEPQGESEAPAAAGALRLVRDPVCGVHVVESRAIPLREGSELLHFCSTGCRDKYVATEKKLAANG